MVLRPIFSGIRMIRILSLNQMESPPEDLTKSISMLSFLFWTKVYGSLHPAFPETHEYSAFCQMVDRSEADTPVIYLCDRGYASYNAFAHVIENGQFFLIRCTDAKTEKILGVPLNGVRQLDYHVDRILSRSHSKKNGFILNWKNNTGLCARMSLWIILHRTIPNTDCPCASSGLNYRRAVTKIWSQIFRILISISMISRTCTT